MHTQSARHKDAISRLCSCGVVMSRESSELYVIVIIYVDVIVLTSSFCCIMRIFEGSGLVLLSFTCCVSDHHRRPNVRMTGAVNKLICPLLTHRPGGALQNRVLSYAYRCTVQCNGGGIVRTK